MQSIKTMKAKNMFGFLVAVLVFVLVAPAVSAFATIDDVTVNGISHYDGETAGVFAGETMSIRVVFTASDLEDDVRVIARILGEPGLSDVTEEFDVLNESTYSRLLHIELLVNEEITSLSAPAPITTTFLVDITVASSLKASISML